MATYQATAGQKVFYSTASTMANPIELVGLTSTPDKGGEPDTVDLSIISEKFKRSLTGQQSMDTMTYEFAPDFTATNGSMDVIAGFLAAGEVWIYEEYVEGTDSNDSHTLGAGIIYKGKAKSSSIAGQSGGDAQSGSVYVQMVGDSIYVASGGASPTYKDLFSGATVTTLS